MENSVPSYASECSPAAVRGFFSGSITVIATMGNLWGAGMSRAYATETTDKGWQIPVAMQLVPAVALAFMVPFCVESPRWLISKGKKEHGLSVLNRLRTKHDVDSGLTIREADALEAAIVEYDRREKGRWIDLFRGNYRRRAHIAAIVFQANQTCGQQCW